MNDKASTLSEACPIDDLIAAISRRAADRGSAEQRIRATEQKCGWAMDNLAESLGIDRASLTIQQVFDCEEKFEEHLNRRSIKETTRASLVSVRNGMIRDAMDLGLFAEQVALEEEWKPVRDAVRGILGALSIISYFIKLLLHTHEVTDAMLDDWGKIKRLEERRSRSYIGGLKSSFRAAIVRHNLQHLFPKLRTEVKAAFLMPASGLPIWLRSDLAAMIRKLRREARLSRARYSPGAAFNLVKQFRYLYGYVHKILNESAVRMEELLDPGRIREYSLFLHKKGWKRESIRQSLVFLANAMRAHPRLGENTFTGVKSIVGDLPPDDDTDMDSDFDGSEVLLEDLANVPGKIRAERDALVNKNPRIRAQFALKEFLTTFIVASPWPPECLRMCRLDDPKRNLFKDKVRSDWGSPASFPWLEQARRDDLPVWQFDFNPENFQLSRYAWGPLIPPLVEALEAYLPYRSALLKGRKDPGTLLVNFAGKPFDSRGLARLISDTFDHYLGHPVTLREIRRKYILDWNAEYPEDEYNLGAVLLIQADSVRLALRKAGVESRSPIDREREWVRKCHSYR